MQQRQEQARQQQLPRLSHELKALVLPARTFDFVCLVCSPLVAGIIAFLRLDRLEN